MARTWLRGLLCSITFGLILFYPVMNSAQEAPGGLNLQETIDAALTANLGLNQVLLDTTRPADKSVLRRAGGWNHRCPD